MYLKKYLDLVHSKVIGEWNQRQTIVWTNNDNFIHAVTQKPFTDDSETFPSKFDSGIFNKGQSFVHSFNEEGRTITIVLFILGWWAKYL